nr:nucleoside triphosphate pyrophosphohydrolase [Aliikangiella coralliicola]
MQKENIAEKLLAQVENSSGIDKLLAVMSSLRDREGGCPWDLEQDYQTILPFTIEEVYEVAEAIESKDFDSLKDELGDLLFQVVFYAQLTKEEKRFDFYAIVENICDKLVRRHPHVFGDVQFESEKQLKQAWEEQKHQERQQKSKTNTSVLDDIPKALPELKRAQKIQKRVAKIGFDWENVDQVWDKVKEECEEITLAADQGDSENLEEEVGDLLFAVVNLSRHYGIDADMALRKANQKFDSRFRKVETFSEKPLNQSTLEELELLWQRAKKTR